MANTKILSFILLLSNSSRPELCWIGFQHQAQSLSYNAITITTIGVFTVTFFLLRISGYQALANTKIMLQSSWILESFGWSQEENFQDMRQEYPFAPRKLALSAWIYRLHKKYHFDF